MTAQVLKLLNGTTLVGVPVLRVPILALGFFVKLGLAAAIFYIGSIVAGAVAGFALPTTAIFRWFDVARTIGLHEHYIAHLILLLCCLSAFATWIADGSSADVVASDETALVTFFQRWGLLLIATLFVFSISGWWVGLPRPGDFNGASIGGLLPFSDANGYFANTQDQLKEGTWNIISMRRPLAAAFRSILGIAGGFSYSTMLLIQGILAALSVWVAVRSLIRWRGPIAGLAFVAVSFMVYRSFLATSLTEPLGLIWAFLSAACFAEALRSRSLAFALLGFALTVLALMTRMGAMFLIPALVLWLLICFGTGWKAKLKISVLIVAIVGGVYLLNAALQKSYGNGGDISGSNFAYSLCGLSIGKAWSECAARFADERKAAGADEKKFTDFLYAQALQNIQSNPTVIVKRLALGAVAFVASLPRTLTDGYLRASDSAWCATLFILTSIVGIGLLSIRRPEPFEVAFWVLSITSILASSMFVYFDDGRRVMTASYPLITMLLASGLANPFKKLIVPQTMDRRLLWGCPTFIALAVAAFFVAPSVAHHLAPEPLPPALDSSKHQVWAGRRLSGFLVLPDSQRLPKDIVAIHYSDFAKIVALSGVEGYQGLLHPQSPNVPFGFITVPRRERGASSESLYVVPPEVLLRKEVGAWKFSTADWNLIPGKSPYWRLVTRAEPVDENPR
ncbi:hypothetical protein ACSVBT_05410 [Afipia sp. TerB]